jgi:microcin C transport system permease protein
MRPRLNPLTAKKLRRFREIRRGFWSFVVLLVLISLSLVGELLINSRAIAVRFEGQWSFPTYTRVRLGSDFGLEGEAGQIPVDYRELDRHFAEQGSGNIVILPPIPYDAYENSSFEGVFKPAPPSWSSRHLIGTDSTGRDIFARLVFGFRTAILFALAFMALTYLIGISLGCLMGYFGGAFDLLFQRLIEIWSNIPFLYMVIIVFSVIPTSFDIPTRIAILLFIMVLFSWTSMTYYMRTATYREKERDYAAAAIVLGASTPRVIFNHIIPNVVSTIVTFVPITVVNAIVAVTALDFLGWGLPPPTPSIGELLKQGTSNLTTAPWIVSSAFVSLVFLLTLVNFVGEAVREAFDPKKHTVYK